MTESPRVKPLEFEDIEDVAAAIREAGGRLTATRRLVLEALFEAEGPMSAERIASRLAGRGPAFDLPSVYRNLERLEALGVIRHVHLGHGPGLYALVGSGEREYLRCERCRRVTSVSPPSSTRCARRSASGSDTTPASATSRSPACARNAPVRSPPARARAQPRRLGSELAPRFPPARVRTALSHQHGAEWHLATSGWQRLSALEGEACGREAIAARGAGVQATLPRRHPGPPP